MSEPDTPQSPPTNGRIDAPAAEHAAPMPMREAIAMIEVGQTTVTPVTARTLVTWFVLATAFVPLAEIGRELRPSVDGAASAWSHLAAVPAQVRQRLAGPAEGDARSRVVAANRDVLGALDAFERALDHDSTLGRALRAPAQLLMSTWLGTGNERVYHGRDGWLFYAPDVEYVTGPGFLTPAQLERRVESAEEWTAPPQPDPRLAIAQFHRDLARRGITLIVMPTPVKPTVHAEKLARGGAGRRTPVENPSYLGFVTDLRAEGVLVFDPAEALVQTGRASPAYLATDTHWRPEAMELVAALLTRFIEDHVDLPPVADQGYRVEPREVRQAGDTALMLDLPRGQSAYPSETVWVRRVVAGDGTPWRPSPRADVLVLGDSFSNIYSLASMGWGQAAGFVEQLSYALQRPVARIVRNDDGAFATRAVLSREPQRLTGVRVVVYQFATRELALGDWKLLPGLPSPALGSTPR